MRKAYFHLPGLYQFLDLYKVFLPLFFAHKEYFNDFVEIGSIYGSPMDCLWGGGRIEESDSDSNEVLELLQQYGVSARLTLSNSLLTKEHLKNKTCNDLCALFSKSDGNGVIISSELLLNYLQNKYPNLYFVSSTTKVLTSFKDFKLELDRRDFKYVVPDFRLNKSFDNLSSLSKEEKDKVELLCNECCYIGCSKRKECYENVSRLNLGEDPINYKCEGNGEYSIEKAMKNSSFISISDIKEKYLPMGFTNFKIEGRGLGSAIVIYYLVYYLVRPEYQEQVKDILFRDNNIDLY